MTGYGSPATVRERIESADALLVIGCRLNEIASFEYSIPSATTKWAHVDREPRTAHAGLRPPDIASRPTPEPSCKRHSCMSPDGPRSSARRLRRNRRL